MNLRLTVASLVVLCFPLNGIAQSNGDAICQALLRDGQSGLFRPAASFQQRVPYEAVNGRPLDYRHEARFYYVPRYNAGEEGVWHIRTQTRTAEPRGADQVYLDRPFTDTRCSRKRGRPLALLDDRYYDLSQYAEHHGPGQTEDGRRWGYKDWSELANKFHFEIEDRQAREGCLSTDDRFAFKKWSTYGFEGVAPEPSRQQQALRWGPNAAIAQPAPKHDGLSSEFRYYDGAGPVCLSFVAPLSTFSIDRTAANRRPASTSIIIQRLQGRTVTRLESTTVRWN